MILDGPTAEKEKEAEDEKTRQLSLNRARKILGTFYIVMPFVLVYLLFKIFPPQPWWPSDWRSVQMVFFIPKLNIWTTLEERLILLVVVAGGLGSYIHSATSYADFRGNRQFAPSWLLWYVLRPFIGMSLALVVYFAIRGGLLSVILSGNEANDATKINPFGIGAIACLTGMFSKQAADKLAEVFGTLFKSGGDASRKDSLTPAPPPDITSVDPKQGPSLGGTKVTISGTGFAKDATVFFGPAAATNVSVVNDSTITAETPAGEGVVDVVVTNADGLKATSIQGYTFGDGGASAAVSGAEVSAAEVETLDGHDADLKADTADEHLPITEGGVE